MAEVAQFGRALDCGSSCRGFDPRPSPHLIHLLLFIPAILRGLLERRRFPVVPSVGAVRR